MIKKSTFQIILAELLCCVLATSALIAQTSFGRIAGSVTDPSGAAIAGATIKFTNTETQAIRTAQTDAGGNYSVTNLPIGPYLL